LHGAGASNAPNNRRSICARVWLYVYLKKKRYIFAFEDASTCRCVPCVRHCARCAAYNNINERSKHVRTSYTYVSSTTQLEFGLLGSLGHGWHLVSEPTGETKRTDDGLLHLVAGRGHGFWEVDSRAPLAVWKVDEKCHAEAVQVDHRRVNSLVKRMLPHTMRTHALASAPNVTNGNARTCSDCSRRVVSCCMYCACVGARTWHRRGPRSCA